MAASSAEERVDISTLVCQYVELCKRLTALQSDQHATMEHITKETSPHVLYMSHLVLRAELDLRTCKALFADAPTVYTVRFDCIGLLASASASLDILATVVKRILPDHSSTAEASVLPEDSADDQLPVSSDDSADDQLPVKRKLRVGMVMDGEPDDLLAAHLLLHVIASPTNPRITDTDDQTYELCYLGVTSGLPWNLEGKAQWMVSKLGGHQLQPAILHAHAPDSRTFVWPTSEMCYPMAPVGKYCISRWQFSEMDVLLVTAPPVDLIGEMMESPDSFLQNASSIDLVVSGSFNFRMLREHGITTDTIIAFLRAFRTARIFESYAGLGPTSSNVINAQTYPVELMRWIMSLPGMKELVEKWDAFNKADCIDTMRTLAGLPPICVPADSAETDDVVAHAHFHLARLPTERARAQFKRNLQCWQQLREYGGNQLVAADVATVVFMMLILDIADEQPFPLPTFADGCMTPIDPAFDEETGYFAPVTVEESRITYMHHTDGADLLRRFLTSIAESAF